MNISEETISEFKRIVMEDYGKEITLAEATRVIHGLVDYFDLLAQIHHRTQKDNN